MSFNPYMNHSDMPKMRNSVVACLNILGSKEMIKNDQEGIILQKFYNTLRFAKSIDAPGKIDQFDEHSFKIITDYIVYGQPIENEGELKLVKSLLRLAACQLHMSMNGCFIRGCMGVGYHYMDDEIVYGPTLIEASMLERMQAVEPRIILSKSAGDLVQKHIILNKKSKISLPNFFVLKDNDNVYFLNYLAASVVNYGDGNIAPKLISIHKKQVIEKLKQFRNKPKVWSKYLWVANYHNHFCTLYPNLNIYKINDKILRLEIN